MHYDLFDDQFNVLVIAFFGDVRVASQRSASAGG